MRFLILLPCFLVLGACQSAYYDAAENFGIYKRDILVDRVEDSREAQQEAEEQFQSALEQLSLLINFDGGDLEDVYEDMNEEYEEAVEAADEVRSRIKAIESVAGALFAEWEGEIEQYSSNRLKTDSRQKLAETQKRYQEMIVVLHNSESKMDPVLSALKDNGLYLKHNLNARAVASLKVEFKSIEGDIDILIQEMRKAIASSDEFIASMK